MPYLLHAENVLLWTESCAVFSVAAFALQSFSRGHRNLKNRRKPKLDLTGKRTLITAGAAGIGRRTAELFSEAGAKVFICDIDRDQLEDARDKVTNLNGTVTDVSDQDALKDMFKAAIAELGGLDILVNNAGTAGPTERVEEISLEDWRNCLDINLTSTFLMSQMAVPYLRDAGGGSIINLSSAAGKFGFPTA